MPDKLKATDLRLILIGALILIIGVHIGLTVYGQKLLLSSSDDVTDAVTQAHISKATLDNLQESKRLLDTQRDTFERSKGILVDAKSDNYQRQIIEQVTSYAQIAGVTVTGFTFQSQNGSSTSVPAEGGAAAPSPPAAGSTASGQPPVASGKSPSSSTPKSVTVTLDLKTPIDYPVFLSFIQLLQNNVTQFKVEILSLSATGTSEASSGSTSEGGEAASRGTSLSIPTLTMEIYTK